MAQLFDKEIRLPCECGDPWHFIHFGFNKPDEKYWPDPMLVISKELFFGSFWKRLKHAVKHLFRGWSKVGVDSYIENYDDILRLALFLRDCIDSLDNPKDELPVKKISIIYSRKDGEYLVQENGTFTARKTLEDALSEAKGRF